MVFTGRLTSCLTSFVEDTPTAMSSLSLAKCGLTDMDIVVLERFLCLAYLDLRQNLLTCEGAVHLCNNPRLWPQLSTLRLANNDFGDSGVTALALALADNTSVTYLDLRSTGFHAEGMAALASTLVANKTISVLLLGDNLIKDAGGRALAGALSRNAGLRELNMAANGLGAEGAASLFASLQHNNHLTTLRVNNVPVTQYTVAPLRQVSPFNVALTALQLCFCDMSDTDVMHLCLALGQQTVVQELNVSQNKFTHLGGQVFGKILKTNTTFKKLKLRGNKIGSVGSEAIFEGLAHNSCLEHLDMSDNGVRSLTGAALKSNKTLVSLKLSDNPHLDFDWGLATLLTTNTTLLDIELKNTVFDDTRIASINMAVSLRPRGAPPLNIDLRGTGAGLYVPTCGLHASLHLVCAGSRD